MGMSAAAAARRRNPPAPPAPGARPAADGPDAGGDPGAGPGEPRPGRHRPDHGRFRRCCSGWRSGRPGTTAPLARCRDLPDDVRPTVPRRDGRLSSPVHASRLQDHAVDARRAGGAAARWRSRARSSRGSPTTASTTRTPTAGRPAQPPCRPRRRAGAARCAASSTRMSAGCSTTSSAGPANASRRTCSPTRSSASSTDLRPLVAARPGDPVRPGWLIGGTARRRLSRRCCGAGAVRVLVLHHVTYSINSLCHFFGRRRFETDDHSRNLLWLTPFSMGEAWHNNHHAFPTSAIHGMGARRARPLRSRDPRAGAGRARLGRPAGQPRAPGRQGALTAPERARRGCRVATIAHVDATRTVRGQPPLMQGLAPPARAALDAGACGRALGRRVRTLARAPAGGCWRRCC